MSRLDGIEDTNPLGYIRTEIAQKREERGAAMVETAMVIPLVIFMIIATLNFGFAMYNRWYLVSTVVPETATYAAEVYNLEELRVRAFDLMMAGLFRVSFIDVRNTDNSAARTVTMTINCTYDFLIPFPGWSQMNISETFETYYGS